MIVLLYGIKETHLQMLNNILNDMEPDIKLTLGKCSTEIPILDVLVKKENDKNSIVIFYKTTDTRQYLHFGSSHLRQIKKRIPYNLVRKICTIVSNEETKKIIVSK